MKTRKIKVSWRNVRFAVAIRLTIMLACMFTLACLGQGSLVTSNSIWLGEGIVKQTKPSMEQAREFFNWRIEKQPIYTGETVIPGWAAFKRSDTSKVLHVGLESYSPAAPLEAFDQVEKALRESGKEFSVNGVGVLNHGEKVFGQFDVGGEFNIKGKKYDGMLSFAMGTKEQLSLIVFLTLVCIVCQNTLAMALKDARNATKRGETARVKFTKHSSAKVSALANSILQVFELREAVIATLKRMADEPITMTEAERAFLGLMHLEHAPEVGKEMKQTKITRTQNRLDAYKDALVNSPGNNGELTKEAWLNAVTYIDTHGSKLARESKDFSDAKQFESSEFGAYAKRKQSAFALASDSALWLPAVATGDQIMAGLLARPVVLNQSPTIQSTQGASLMAGLLAKS